jgi:endo-1,4-beta-xylanase
VGTLPSGGSQKCTSSGTYQQNTADGQTWTMWSAASSGQNCINTFASAEAYGATWGGGDFLARLGWTGDTPYSSLGTVTAQFAESHSGTAGGYSYIGMYGWSSSGPCIEWYIVDDTVSGNMPSQGALGANPAKTTSFAVDGGTYSVYTVSNRTGSNSCSDGSTSWTQYWSVRSAPRDCGTISVSEHFSEWASLGMPLGNVTSIQVNIEAGGGSGSINFPTAIVTKN